MHTQVDSIATVWASSLYDSILTRVCTMSVENILFEMLISWLRKWCYHHWPNRIIYKYIIEEFQDAMSTTNVHSFMIKYKRNTLRFVIVCTLLVIENAVFLLSIYYFLYLCGTRVECRWIFFLAQSRVNFIGVDRQCLFFLVAAYVNNMHQFKTVSSIFYSTVKPVSMNTIFCILCIRVVIYLVRNDK